MFVTRYWFEWSDRISLARMRLRIQFMADGKMAIAARAIMPKVRVCDTLADGRNVYDASVWVLVDLPADQPLYTTIRYTTQQGFRALSEEVELALTGRTEDLSIYG